MTIAVTEKGKMTMIDVFWLMVGVFAGTLGIIAVACMVTGKEDDDADEK